MENENEPVDAVVVYQEAPQSLTDLSGDDLVEIANSLDKKITAQTKILSLVAKLAGTKGIDKLGGTNYFNSGGCDRIFAGVGGSYGKPVEERRTLADGYVEYIFTGTFTLGNRSITATGSRSTNDLFFAQRTADDGTKYLLDPQDVKTGDVRKAAWTNCKNNGIKSLLGLRNLSEEMLQAHGVVTDQGAKVNYGNVSSEDSKDRRVECGKMLKELADGDAKAGADLLFELTQFPDAAGKLVGGKRDIGKLTEKQLMNDHKNAFYAKLCVRHAAWVTQYENLPTPEEAAAKAFEGMEVPNE